MLRRFNKKIWGDSLFRLLVLGYTIFLIFPIIVSLVVYRQTEGIITDEITHQSETQCVMLAQQFDTQISIIETIMAQIAGNERLTQHMRQLSAGQALDAYEASILPNELNYARLNIPSIASMFLYFHDTDLVISDTGVMKRKIAYDIFGDFKEDMDFDSWNTLMRSTFSRTTMAYGQRNGIKTEEDQFAYIQSLPFENPCATLVILVSVDSFLQATGQISDAENSIYILDQQGEPLLSKSAILFPEDIREQCLQSHNMFYHKLHGEDYAIVSTNSNVLKNLTYVSMFSKESFLDKVNKIRSITYLSLLVVLVIGCLGIYFVARKNTAPVHQMITTIARKLDIAAEECTDQYNVLVNAVDIKLSKNNKKIYTQEETLKTYFIQSLLLEESSRKNVEKTYLKAKEHHIYYEDGNYVVILLNVYDSEKFFEDSEIMDAVERGSLVSLVLSNVLSDLFSSDYHCVTVPLKDSDGSVASIVCVDKQDEIEEIISETYGIISEQFGIFFTSAISGRHPRSEWNEAYYEALSVSVNGPSGDEMTEEMGDVLIAKYIPITQTDGYILTEETERQLMNYMFIGSISDAKECVSNILHSCANMPLDYMVSIKFCILSALIKSLPDNIRSKFCHELAPAMQLAKCKTPTAIREMLFGLMDTMHLRMSGEKRTTVFSQKIIDFIAAHYSDIGLSIVMIADYLQMNPHYVSTRFKEETGESPRAYINAYRIERAKELLVQSNKKLREIAELVGFIDDNAFIRVFKRCEGITPGTYRKAHGQ